MRGLRLIGLLAWLALTMAPEPGRAESPADREENALRLRQAVRTSGIDPGADFDRKVAALTDAQLETLVDEHDTMGYDENPLTVIIGAIILLILFVLVVVAAVD